MTAGGTGRPAPPRAPLSAQDVLTAKFQATKFRWGYDQTEVDDYLDQVAAAFKGTGPHIPAREVRAKEFRRTRWREGYDIEGVDALMDAIARTLGG
jgi:DivIVA domain-containing protein